MTGPRPQLARIEPTSEVQSSVTLLDFFRAWYRYRYWFVVGLLIATVGTFVWNKFFLVKYYRAESRIDVSRQIPPEQRIGFVDVQATGGGRNEQYLNLKQAMLAEQMLTSADLLMEVTERLKNPKPGSGQAWDLYELLGVREADPQRRRDMLLRVLQTNVVQVRQLQNTGLMLVGAELPNPIAAAQFVNTCVAVLQERFTKLDFDYYDEALKLYQQQYNEEQKRSEQRARDLNNFNTEHYYDKDATFAQKIAVMKEELDTQAKWIAALRDKLGKLRLATDPQAKAAALGIKVIDPARVPLKKSRPQTIVNTLVGATLYSFVFMIGLAVVSYVDWSRRTRRPESGE